MALFPKAFAAARAISSDYSRVRALAVLAPYLPEALLSEAAAAARALSSDYYGVDALAALAPHLPEAEREAALREALAPHLRTPPLRPQLFVTRVIGNEDQPDVEILTLPAYPSDIAMDIEQVRQEVLLSDEFQVVRESRIEFGPNACLTALHRVIIDAGVRENLPWEPVSDPDDASNRYKTYAQEIFASQPVPVMNSPVSGSTLLQMVTATGGGAAFMAAFPSADATHIAIYFLMIGGTRIVLGAADGISIGLKQGLPTSC